MTNVKLEKEFGEEMMSIYRRANSEIGYNPTEFLNMLHNHGAVETARRLINSKDPTSGYTKLWEHKRLGLTVEAVVCDNPKWHPLFDVATLNAARKRLKEYGHDFKSLFYKWMVGTGLSESSALKYSGAIEGPLSDWARDAKIIAGSILDITDARKMAAAVLEIRKLPIFLERDATGHHMYSSALKKYSEYLYMFPDSGIENDIADILSDPETDATEKARLVSARVGQGQYRKDLIDLWEGCSVTGYKDASLLVASHIKPWSKSTNVERLDKFNGLLLLPNLDKAFDKGLISFDSQGKILISEKFQKFETLGISQSMSVKLSKEHLSYLEHHRKKHGFNE